ncbi:MAG: hypothetical protein U0798_11280 [Gemmataceae bacterium]
MTAFAGCGGSSSKRITVTGTVTLNGEPLPQGQIVLQLGSGSNLEFADIKDGKFEISGVPAGPAKAAVRTSYIKSQMEANNNFAQQYGAKQSQTTLVEVPARYESPKTAQLEVVLESGTPLELKLKN